MVTRKRLYSESCYFGALAGIPYKCKQCHTTLTGLSSVCAKLEPASSKNDEILEINVLQKFTPHALYQLENIFYSQKNVLVLSLKISAGKYLLFSEKCSCSQLENIFYSQKNVIVLSLKISAGKYLLFSEKMFLFSAGKYLLFSENVVVLSWKISFILRKMLLFSGWKYQLEHVFYSQKNVLVLRLKISTGRKMLLFSAGKYLLFSEKCSCSQVENISWKISFILRKMFVFWDLHLNWEKVFHRRDKKCFLARWIF